MTGYLNSAIKQFEYYKLLGDKTFEQLSDESLFYQFNADSNSVATIVKHLAGNMRSRWTDFLTTDGEKPGRDREAEFDNDISAREAMVDLWNRGWITLLTALNNITDDDLDRIVYIRNQGHTVLEAINRQLAHYPYHIGQIVYLGKMMAEQWNSLSIPRGGSDRYNADKFSQPAKQQHFTDEFLKKKPGE